MNILKKGGEPVRFDKRFVLIAHYSIEFRCCLRVALEERGYEVDFAEDSEEISRSLFSGHPPDVVVLSVSLPRKSGVEFAQEFRAIKPVGRAVKFMIVADVIPAEPKRQELLGCCDALIARPMFDSAPHRVVACIGEMCSQSK